jgi:hypothetical protein
MPYYLSADGLSADDLAAVEQHLASCPPCAARAKAERAFDEKLGRAMADAPVPDGLRERLNTRLAVDRSKYWRKQASWATAAAAVLIALILGASLRLGQRTEVDLAEVAYVHSGGWVSTDGAVVERFREQGVNIRLPGEFDPQWLTGGEVVLFMDRRVGRLDYTRGTARAHVYVLPKRSFKVKKGTSSELVESTGRWEVIDTSGDFMFLVNYEGDGGPELFRPAGEIVG